MVPKKVGSITLEYDRGDGVIESQAFDAEFQNALITGDISALTGTFAGKLDVNALDVVSRLNISGRAVAITSVASTAIANPTTHQFNDDGVWRTLISTTVDVPQGTANGTFAAIAVQYKIADQRGDNDQFPYNGRLVIDGTVYDTVNGRFGIFYRYNPCQIYEVVYYLAGAGTHTISFDVRWFDMKTNVYPEFTDIVIRCDVIRK